MSFVKATFKYIQDTFDVPGFLGKTVNYFCQKYLRKFSEITEKNIKWVQFYPDQIVQVNAVELTPQAINESLEGLPFELVEGYVDQISLKFPWQHLKSKPSEVHLKDVDIAVRPKAPTNKAALLLEAMSASMMQGMDASICMAKKAVEEQDESVQNDCVNLIAQYIDEAKQMLHLTLENVTIRMEAVDEGKVMALEIHIEKAEYFDDRVEKSWTGEEDQKDGESTTSSSGWLNKNVRVMGVTVRLDDEAVPCPFANPPPEDAPSVFENLTTSSSGLYRSALEDVEEGEQEERDPPRAIPVPIGVFTGRSDVKIIMKGNDNMEGPQMDASATLGAFHSLMSPRQLGSLIKVVSAFASPPESGLDPNSGALNQRMGPDDYHTVGQVLDQDMRSGQFEDVMNTYAEDCNYLASGDPMFHTMEPVGGHPAFDMHLSTSSLDSATTMSTMPRSVTPEIEQKRKEKAARKARESLAKAADPGGEVTKVQLTVATVSLCLLHEELCEPGGLEDRTWATSMIQLAKAYFKELKAISTVGHKSLRDFRDAISSIVQRDHLGLLCKPVSLKLHDDQVLHTQKWELEASVHQAELVECLFGSSPKGPCFEDNPPSRIPQYCEIVTFNNAQSQASKMDFTRDDLVPALHLKLVTSNRTGPGGHTCRYTKVDVGLGKLVTELDITVQDRLATLISTLSGPPKPSPSSVSQPFVDMDQRFKETLEDATMANHNVDFTLNTQKATLRLRFPIPNLNPPNQHAPREWWGRNLHKESLLLEVEQLKVRRYISADEPSSSPSCVELICNKLDVFFQEDFNKNPRLFGSIMQGSGDIGENFNCPMVIIKKFPPMGSPLLDTMSDGQTSCMEGSKEDLGSLQKGQPKPGSTPFTRKKEYLNGTAPLSGDDAKGFEDLFEGVAPGTKLEMQQFMDMSMSNTSLLVEITAPKVLVVLHDKQFLELLYNRINNDLLLWEPQSPSPPETFASGQSLNIQPQYLYMMKSLGESAYSNNGSDEDLPSASAQSLINNSDNRQQSSLCLSLNIGEGKLFTTVPITKEVQEKDDGTQTKVYGDGCHGEMALLLKEACMFISVGHEGNKDLRYVVISSNRAQLLHAGCVEDQLVAAVTMNSLDTLTFDSKGKLDHLTRRIMRSAPTVPVVPLVNVGAGEGSEDMVAVAIQIKLDEMNNCKYFDITAAIRGATLRHETNGTGESWISQIMELVNLEDYPIEGYLAPAVLTNLNLGLRGCAIDYRPQNFDLMTLRSMLTMEKFRLTTCISTDAKVQCLKFVLEEFRLLISNKDTVEVNLQRDYLQIAELGILEVGYRIGQADEKGSKKFLWFGNNRVEIKVCYDSGAAFIQLMMHLVYGGDLGPPKEDDTSQEELLLQLQTLDERTEEENHHVEESIADALKEQGTPTDSPEKEGASRPLYFMAPEGGADPQRDACDNERVKRMLAAELGECQGDTTVSVSDDDEDFTIIDCPGMGLASKDGNPEKMGYLATGGLLGMMTGTAKTDTGQNPIDDLKTPSGWPVPEFKVLLAEMNFDLCIFDGSDFAVKKGSRDSRGKESEDYGMITTFNRFMFGAPKAEEAAKTKRMAENLSIGSRPLYWNAGPGRNNDIMVRLYVAKFRVQYEVYHESEDRSRRLVMLAHKVEVEDHLKTLSSYNKLLYWPDSLSHTASNMVRLKVSWQRPDSRYETEEVSTVFTLQKININLNQNTYVFLEKYLINVTEMLYGLAEDSAAAAEVGRGRDPSLSPAQTPRRKKSVSTERVPIFSTEGGQPREELAPVMDDDSLMSFSDSPSNISQASAKPERPPRIRVEPEDDPTFFKSFIMTRDVPLTMCYQGTLAGVKAGSIKTIAYTALQGLAQVENLQVKLISLELKQGYRGIDKLMDAIQKAWMAHIYGKHITTVLGSIGPLHIITTILQGLSDFVKMPYIQYQKDGRVWRGFQKGTLSLKKCTQTALFDLLKKVIDSIMVCSSICFDVLSSSKNPNRIRNIAKTPKDIREGMSGAALIVREGISGTISDLIRDTSQQREQKGLHGAVGYLLKNIPATVGAMPVQVLSAGVGQCVTGIRHEVRPDLLKADQEKYKDLN